MRIRPPSVSGTFYSATPEALSNQIKRCFVSKHGAGTLPTVKEDGPRAIKAVICPHAGYAYSGPTASHSYYNLAVDGRPRKFVILGPNHTGMGAPVALMSQGSWRTPLGDVQVDEKLARKILNESAVVVEDEAAHMFEHSIEVQLPFLQYVYGSFTFVPICMMLQDLKTSRDVGKSVGKACIDEDVIIIASTDFTHYEPQERAKKKDRVAINAIMKMDADELQSVVQTQNITMCGVGPVTSAIIAAKALGATQCKLASYTTSGDVTGDYGAVVGYASILMLK